MTIFLIVLLVCVYFAPTVLGLRTPNAPMIFMLNLLFGWTVIGWAASLSLALWQDKREAVYLGNSSCEGYAKVSVKVLPKVHQP
jgi:hypothetical protein